MSYTRRRFLQCLGALSITTPFFMRSLAMEADASTDTVVIIVALSSGNDGFNTVLPIDSTRYGNYQQQRPNIAVSMNDIAASGSAFDSNPAMPGSSSSEWAMHPMLSSLGSTSATNNFTDSVWTRESRNYSRGRYFRDVYSVI